MIKLTSDNLIDTEKIDIKDVIPADALNEFQENLASGLNTAITVTDKLGKPVTACSHYCKYCDYYVRSSRVGLEKCDKFFRKISDEAKRTGKPYAAKCHAELTEFAVPVFVGGEYLGSVIGGQLVTEKYRDKDIKAHAAQFGSNSESMLAAINEMERFDKKKIETLMNVISSSYSAMAEKGYLKVYLEQISKQLTDGISEVEETIGELIETADVIKNHQNQLNSSVANVEDASVKIDDVLKSITQLANQTTILSFNAQIEAVRAGEIGKSFTVVAGEIKELADSSKKTAESIGDLTAQIKTNVETTVQCADETLSAARSQGYAIDNAKDRVDEIVEISNRLAGLLGNK